MAALPTLGQRRHAAAELACEIRAMWPTLAGQWSRREWNAHARRAAHHYLQNMQAFDRANFGTTPNTLPRRK